jgi:hypothetical protein
MKKYLVVNGGCRGYIDDVEVVESELSLEDFIGELDAEARIAISEIYSDDDELSDEEKLEEANYYIEEFRIGGEILGDGVGCVTYGEESYEYILEVTDENFYQVEEFVNNDDLVYMSDFEIFFNIDL